MHERRLCSMFSFLDSIFLQSLVCFFQGFSVGKSWFSQLMDKLTLLVSGFFLHLLAWHMFVSLKYS